VERFYVNPFYINTFLTLPSWKGKEGKEYQSRLSALGVIQMNPEELERVNVEIIDSFANANRERKKISFNLNVFYSSFYKIENL